MRNIKFFSFILILTTLSCGTIRNVVPLEKDQKEVALSLGGPLIEFSGTTIPLPLSSIDFAYGLTDVYTGFASLHTTALLFGVVQIEGGVLRNLWVNEKANMGLSIAPSFYFMMDVWEYKPKFYPLLDVNFYTKYGKRNNLVYVSASSIFELSSQKAFNENIDRRIIPYLSLGHKWCFNKWDYRLEAKYINFFEPNHNLIVKYKSFGNKGALSINLGIVKKF